MQPDLFTANFTYAQVDGIGRAKQRGIKPQLRESFAADAIGPLIEYNNLINGGGTQSLQSASWFDEHGRRPFFQAYLDSAEHWILPDGRCGFARGKNLLCETKLTSFKIDAHRAALSSGLGSASALVVAAMGELIGNIEDHSEATSTGCAAFLAQTGKFEFVVSDQGIGGLSSLRKCEKYNYLNDEGAALLELIETGVSRYGPNTGHGNGFRPIFERLAEITGQLRFRSGDHALSLDGRFGDKINRQVSQKPLISGFFVAVTCRSRPSR